MFWLEFVYNEKIVISGKAAIINRCELKTENFNAFSGDLLHAWGIIKTKIYILR